MPIRLAALALASLLALAPLRADDRALWVGQHSQCSYNALASVLTSFYGPERVARADRDAFERARFVEPVEHAGFGPYYGWGPWTAAMVNTGRVTWAGRAVSDLRGERFALCTAALPTLKGDVAVVTYAPGEREKLREVLREQLKRGPVVLWCPYASSLDKGGTPWAHVRRVDNATDEARFARNLTHSVALFAQDGDRVLVVDGSTRDGTYAADLDTIVATSAAMAAIVRERQGGERSLLERGFDGVERDEYNVTFVRTPATQPSAAADFLKKHAPERDRALPAEWVDAHAAARQAARAKYAWAAAVDDELFREHVLPYAHLNERRGPGDGREAVAAKAAELVASCATAREAVEKLNAKLFPALGVAYHPTKRPKPDQCSAESIAAGYASCTGLSVLLAEACRSVAIPARLVGTPGWFNGTADASGHHGGNHTWVEVWVEGKWHPVGAAEPAKLGDVWFAANAARASQTREAKHQIYAARFTPSPAGTSWPMVWADGDRSVHADVVSGAYK